MAKTLMHGRVAQNYAAMGYYPTDDGTMRGIINLLAPSEQALKFLDPCCGEGTALAQLAYRDRYPFAERYGIELDEGRAATAKAKLTALLEGSALSTHVTPQSVDVLFLNPPYAQALRDSDQEDEAARLEHQFLSRFFPALHAGGILIYIIPMTSFDRRWQRWLLARFTDLGVWQAATDRFKQIVIIGRKSAAPLQVDAKMSTPSPPGRKAKPPGQHCPRCRACVTPSPATTTPCACARWKSTRTNWRRSSPNMAACGAMPRRILAVAARKPSAHCTS